MKAKELRIGNLVFDDNGDITEVFSLDDYDGSNEINKDFVSFRYKPIELTNGFLIALGFETDDILYYKGKLAIGSFKDGYYYTPSGLSGRRGIKIKSVHQLQNLYFAITGKELTLKK